MSKDVKNKNYTEDVVLNKILKDISEENLEAEQNSYEDDMIKYYREQDILEKKQKHIKTAKILGIFSIFIFLILVITYYLNSEQNKQTQVKKPVTPTPIPQPIVKKITEPAQPEPAKIESKKIVPIKTEPKKVVLPPVKQPIKEMKTERELAKEMLLRQMKN